MSITDVALEHPECARVIHSLGVTLCSPDERTLQEICDASSASSAEVYLALERVTRERAEEWPERDWSRTSTPGLVGHIIERHHNYLREVGPAILHMTEHLARAHRHADLHHHARELFDTLTAHLDYEERALFPALMMHPGGASSDATRRGLTVTHADHNEIARAQTRLRRCAREGQSFDRCITRRVLSRELDHLDRDLKRHTHLEVEVLMKRFD